MNLVKFFVFEVELLVNVYWLVGFWLGEIVEMLNIFVLKDLKYDKGWVG